MPALLQPEHITRAMRAENRPLTAIRGLAALWVVAYHAQADWAPHLGGVAVLFLRQGYLAVDIFFVLSGFIMALVHRTIAPAGAALFWKKRIARIYPLHVCIMALLAGLALRHLIAGQPDPGSPWREFPAVLLLLQSYLLPGSNWNPPSWSVGVELACYAIFPVAMPLLRRVRGGWRTVLVALLCLAETIMLQHCDGATNGPAALLRGLCGFSLGAALCQLDLTCTRRAASLGEAMATLCMAAGLLCQATQATVLGAALLIALLATRTGPLARALSHPACVWLGTISFSIYLLHAPLIGIVTYHLGLPDSLSIRAAALTIILLPLATLTWRTIEKPTRL